MENVFSKSALAGAMCLLVIAAATPALAADLYMAVKAPPGMTLNFVAADSNKRGFFRSTGNGISHRTEQGWYIQKLPANFDVSKMYVWCADVMEPDELFGESVCSRKGTHEVPEDGIFKLVLDL